MFFHSTSNPVRRKSAQSPNEWNTTHDTFGSFDPPGIPTHSWPPPSNTLTHLASFASLVEVDPHGRTYFWIAGTRTAWSRRGNSDHEALRRGLVSITPIHLDITHYQALEHLEGWDDMIARGRSALGKKHRRKRRS